MARPLASLPRGLRQRLHLAGVAPALLALAPRPAFAADAGAAARHALADSVRRSVLAVDLLRAPEMALRHLRLVESAAPVDSAELFDALGLVVESLADVRPVRAAELDSAFVRMRRLAAAAPAPTALRRRASLARLQAVRDHAAASFQSARTSIQVADSLFRAAGATDEPEYAAVLKLRALHQRGGEKMPAAEQFLVRAAEILERRCGADSDSLWEVLAYRASNFLGPGSLTRSLALYARVNEAQRRLLGPRALRRAQSLYNLGAIESRFGLTDRASRSVEEAMAIVEPYRSMIPGWRMSALLNLLGVALDQTGEVTRAESAYVEAMREISREFGDEDVKLVHPLANLAALRVDLGRFDEARDDVHRLGALLRVHGDSTGNLVLEHLQLAARIALADGDTAAAGRFLSRRASIEERPQGRDPAAAIYGHLVSAWWAWLAGDRGLALQRAVASEQQARASVLAQAFSASDESAVALRQSSSEALDVLLSVLRHPATSAAERAEGYDAIIRARGLVQEAILARRRDLLLADEGATRQALDRLAALRTQQANAAFEPATAAPDPSLTEQVDLLLGELEIRAPTLSQLDRHSSRGLGELTAGLKTDQAVLSYVRYTARTEPCGSARDRFQREDRYAAFVLPADHGVVQFLDLGPAGAIDSLVGAWRAHVAARTGGSPARAARLREAGAALRERVFDPLLAVAGSPRRVELVPDGTLALVPFNVLPDRDGRLLVESDLEIRLASTERDLLPDDSARPPGRGLLALGGADFDQAAPMRDPEPPAIALASLESLVDPEGPTPAPPLRFDPWLCSGEGGRRFAALPQSAAEARDVGALARRAGLAGRILVGAEASEAAFKQLAPGCEFVHVASHAFWLADSCRTARRSGGSPLLQSGLVLAGANTGEAASDASEDGILTAEEVAALDLRAARAVVLSACESGLGRGVGWEGMLGLRRAFRTAGAGALVTSLWQVDDLWARLWMREFYAEMFGGAPDLAAAARTATRALARRQRSMGRAPDPFVTGAFVVTGK